MCGPGTEVWRVGRERALLAGGPAALLMQLAHPLIAAGVADHSSFRRDPFERLRATLDAVLAISFGDTEQAHVAAARVAATHRRVRGALADGVGTFPAGTPYRATDPALAMWVHATLVYAGLEAYARLVAPLSWERRERYYQEAKRFGRLFGATDAVLPVAYADFHGYVRSMAESTDLAVGRQARELAMEVLNPPVSAALRPALGSLRIVTAGFLPEPLRRQFGLHWERRDQVACRAICAAIRGGVKVLPPAIRYWPHYRSAVRRVSETTGGNNHGERASVSRPP